MSQYILWTIVGGFLCRGILLCGGNALSASPVCADLQVKVLGDQLHCYIHGAMLYHVVAHHLC